MCGIAGVYNYRSERSVTRQELVPITGRLIHRGPDDQGIWCEGATGLGFRRLSIIDLAGGHQPLSNEDRTVWLVFNGEIYNFQSLRAELIRLGHTFATHSDSEVIVHAYEEYGTDCLKHLDGMFAFAVWDGRQQQLLLARDRLGKKPLIYAETPDGLVFASEIQALPAHQDVSRAISEEALVDFLSLGYIPSPATVFKQMWKLPAGHYALAGPRGIRVRPYWSVHYEADDRLSEADATACVRETVEEAVRKRLISDVPLGAFLSGGIDSTIVVGIMSRFMSEPVETFSIGFTDEWANELDYARIAAERFRTKHHAFIVEPHMVDVLPKLCARYGEPFADSSAIPTYYLAELTRRHVTVALSGDGADEIWAGYDHYPRGMQSVHWDAMPALLHYAGRYASQRVPERASRWSAIRRARGVMHAPTLAERYRYWSAEQPVAELEAACDGALLEAVRSRDSYERTIRPWLEAVPATEPLQRMLLADTKTYLPDDILVKVDIASMANSLEVRCPLLDHSVVELAARIPSRLKLRGRTGKYIFRRAFADLLPRELANREKHGFRVPIERWLAQDLADMMRDVLLSSSSLQSGYWKPAVIERLVNEHTTGVARHTRLLWRLLVLELWRQSVSEQTGLASQPSKKTRQSLG